MKKCSGFVRPIPFACTIWPLTTVCKETSGLKQRAGQIPLFLRKYEPDKTHIGYKPHKRSACISQVSTSENLYNCRPSAHLGSVPVENEKYGVGRTETFPILQYEMLASGTISQLTVTILGVSSKKLNLDYLSATLQVRNGWRRWCWKR